LEVSPQGVYFPPGNSFREFGTLNLLGRVQKGGLILVIWIRTSTPFLAFGLKKGRKGARNFFLRKQVY